MNFHNWLMFRNPGEIDIDSALTFGVNAKQEGSVFGRFGTGLKYAIAICLRLGHKIVIFEGTKKHEFSVQSCSSRGREFDIVLHNGGRTGFTTHLGSHWETWMAYRELVCNCVDEGVSMRNAVSVVPASAKVKGKEGETRIFVFGSDMMSVHIARSNWFLDTTPQLSLTGVDIHDVSPGLKGHFFLNGVLVSPGVTRSKYVYNLKCDVDLTEDRQLSPYQMYGVAHTIAKHLTAECTAAQLITTLTRPGSSEDGGLFENELRLHSFRQRLSVYELIALLASNPLLAKRLFPGPIAGLQDDIRERQPLVPYEPSKLEQRMYEKAVEFCEAIGMPIEWPVRFVVNLRGAGIHAEADLDNNEIRIARECFTQGTRYLASTLIEEVMHLRTSYGDCTRELQTALFDTIVKLGEELRGEPL